MAKPRGNPSVQTAKEGSLAKGSGKKATYRQSYADVVQSQDSNVEGLEPIYGSRRMGSHMQSPEFSGLKVKASSFDQSWRKKEGNDGNTKSVLLVMNGGEQVQINDEARRVAASDRLPVSMESDGADLGKGLEERVELENLINVNSSLSGGATTRGEIKPVP
ncbi:hypothetical protein Ancab_001507 [Ancistrocladus abbreviatus]